MILEVRLPESTFTIDENNNQQSKATAAIWSFFKSLPLLDKALLTQINGTVVVVERFV